LLEPLKIRRPALIVAGDEESASALAAAAMAEGELLLPVAADDVAVGACPVDGVGDVPPRPRT
jgi:hypothetical protein